MRVFISWSGERSQRVAEILNERLPLIINSVEPWLSSANIEAGAQWTSDLSAGLNETNHGILCLTSENLSEPWLLFEAGALSKKVGEARVAPYLLDLNPADIEPPLGLFQSIRADREGTHKLIMDLAKTVRRSEEVVLSDEKLDEQFDAWWPTLEQEIAEIPAPQEPQREERSDRELLEEILEVVRGVSRQLMPAPTISGIPHTITVPPPTIAVPQTYTVSPITQTISLRKDAQKIMRGLQKSKADIEAQLQEEQDDETKKSLENELEDVNQRIVETTNQLNRIDLLMGTSGATVVSNASDE